jgi:S-adenosylmethionine:tRNA ribosyltransferase-isomerase
MIAASRPMQRPPDARLLVISGCGAIAHAARSRLADFLKHGDLVVANDAATLPASLQGVHLASGAPIEIRLAGRSSLAHDDLRFSAVVFGVGDWRTRTEDRSSPPALAIGDRLALGPLVATVGGTHGHERLVALVFEGKPDTVWAGVAQHGRPIQYAYLDRALALWDVWTPIAALPVAFEAPSAGFALDWGFLRTLRSLGVEFATITLAAGISSTGDSELDACLPFDEAYRIAATTALAIERTKARGGRIVAVGTTVVRALEHSCGRIGEGLADQRISRGTSLGVVDALLSGTHGPEESHYQVLGAFQDEGVLAKADAALQAVNYRTHEFGDSVLIFRNPDRQRAPQSVPPHSVVFPRRCPEALRSRQLRVDTRRFPA